MTVKSSWYASELRRELGLRNRQWARARAHVESYGNPPVIVYPPENERHGNFFDPAYAAIAARPEWMRRFNKIHPRPYRHIVAGESTRRRARPGLGSKLWIFRIAWRICENT